ncbi:2-oxoglutarate and iron-dependent oxygenase domain-containing protein [Dinoroseobacter sp. PD6]|uniref:isopenicillin N synthase family dioxygenase n=1 Tax=Dinoroseobacter sp. PD6 TaxID=3028384 RepID=UPI00237AB2A4|nr:2-oxoglutarate and iron-dependent oxygenase domain-containing protein [Dinoroseobacter sp. PD6]MDD9716221.1 2-oxoglutarate and iron-dependent oxygenase domain-containing protein [Dinoroseobacter sp. PD6]
MEVPVLDGAKLTRDPQGLSAELGAAARGPGFFLLTEHGIPEALITAVFAEGDRFFDLPSAEKARVAIDATNRGWAAEGTERLDPEGGAVDRKEAFNMGLDLAADDPRVLAGEPFRAANRWPELPGFAPTLRRYFEAVQALGVQVMGLVARDLGLAPDHFDRDFDAPMATLRLLRYPAGDPAAGIGAGAHTDYGALTFLRTDGVPGLQLRVRGSDAWTDVPDVPGAYIVNIGDCLMRWSNDTYVSTPHRVLPPPRPRRSLAFFLDPNPDAVISALPGTGAPKYPETTGADYLRSRLEATYG